MPGTIRLAVGFLLMFGAVGGMENPAQTDYFVEQLILALMGLIIMASGCAAINQHTDQTIDSLKGKL